MSLADFRWLLTQAVSKLPGGPVLFVDASEIAHHIPAERPDITPIVFSTLREPWLRPQGKTLAGVLLGWSHHKEQVRMQLAMLAEQLAVGTRVWLIGGARSGIASAPAVLGDNWRNVQKVAYGGHAELWFAELAHKALERGLEAWQRRFVVDVAGQELVLISLPGVFSHGEVDDGTRLLLEHMPLLPPKARVHDFGCGCGIISAWLKQRQPGLTVSASDINALAHASTKATLLANGLKDVRVHVGAGLSDIAGPLDAIVTNPPFHTGQQIDRRIADELFAAAREKLRKGGALYVVGNSFLPYQAAMEKALGSKAETLAQTRSFRVLRAVRA